MIVTEEKPQTTEAFIWTKDPDPAWVETLNKLSPMSDGQAGLAIAWEPGDPWEPVQRWFIYELIPKAHIQPAILRQLEGPHPRSKGHPCFGTNAYGTWCACAKPAHRWVDGPAPMISRQTWELYRKFGAYARRLWVIQGKHGGHKYQFAGWESRLSAAAGGPRHPPFAGDLPYAEPDSRTWEGVRLYADPELVKMYSGLVQFGMRRPFDLDPSDQRACEFAATELLKSFGLRVAEHADELAWAMKKAGDLDYGADDPADQRSTQEQDDQLTHDDLVHMLRTSN